MINNNNPAIQPAKVRVSITERIVPFAAMALAAIGGAVGGLSIMLLMRTLALKANVGRAALAAGLAESTWFPLAFLYAASLVGVVAVLVAVGRLMIDSKTASPSGISYLVLGVLSLVPIAFVWQAGSLMMLNALSDHTPQGVGGGIQASMSTLTWPPLVIGPLIVLVLLAWSLVPFKAVHGRRFGPVACMIVVEIMLVAATIAFQLRVFELHKIYRSAG